MTQSVDAGEPEQESLEVWLTSTQQATLQRAAQLTGRSMRGFVVASAVAAAEALMHEREVITLSAETSRVFAAALLNPPPPNARLRMAIARYAEVVVEE